MEHTKADQLADLILAVFQLNGVLTDWGDDFVALEGLSSTRWRMLGALALANQSLTTPQIAARMGVTRQGAQKQLNLLIQKKLVEVHPNPMHKRSPLYALTPNGQNTFNTINRRWRIHASQTASLFNSDDLDTVVKVLTALIDVHVPKRQEGGNG
ncbi:MarR family winged helix-turn-helix transcriptional regulator [Bacillus subtilis]|uniref:MarR family winged helix-turn-helix transcriptional regulator n=1 Tax=Bacillus subtilis TaxID=1423 RepID=UPI001293F857|nr:helix-turn-helix domain-containing protein [Bacillus subtilis]MCP6730565.1 MarR family transcriptional regulator [Bacillus subtilis]MDP0484523.1 helix-turn-helix domain-containing protein [Bacillus subtilis]QFY83847.1 MarR family transcriptional regulator [Bacillus subtilis]